MQTYQSGLSALTMNQSITKAGQGELILDGDLIGEDIEVVHGILIIDEPSYDSFQNPSNWVILRDEPSIIVTDLLPVIPQSDLPSFEASGTAIVPEQSSAGLIVGLLAAAYIFLIRRTKNLRR